MYLSANPIESCIIKDWSSLPSHLVQKDAPLIVGHSRVFEGVIQEDLVELSQILLFQEEVEFVRTSSNSRPLLSYIVLCMQSEVCIEEDGEVEHNAQNLTNSVRA